MTLREISERFEQAGIESPKNDATLILCHLFKISAAALLAERNRDFCSPELEAAVSRRCNREPLQYIIGVWSFMNEEYEVSPSCLIPRSDTELLCEALISGLPQGGKFIDLCTGSGCIAVSALAARPDATATAVELFPDTVKTAKRNAEKNGVADRMTFIQADVLKAPPACLTDRFDIIVSNPPYIRTAVLAELEPELTFEPSAALDGGEDGLIFYRKIVGDWSKLLSPGGKILLEIGYDQGNEIKDIAVAHGYECSLHLDAGGNVRVAELIPSL